jgi:hypothetical protein
MVQPRMPFGKHRGKRLCDVPLSYLVWVANTCNLDYLLRRVVEQEVERRAGQDDDPGPQPQRHPPPSVDWWPIVKRWYGEMALRFHPDRGGSHAAMVAINEVRGRLEELLEASA